MKIGINTLKAKYRGDWILFFLRAVSNQARRNTEKARQVLNLYNPMRIKIADITKSPQALKVLDSLFLSPVISRPDFIKLSGLESQSAHRIISKLKSGRIQLTIRKHAGRLPEVLAFTDLYHYNPLSALIYRRNNSILKN